MPGEKLQWILTIGNTLNTLKDFVDMLVKSSDRLPDKVKQRLPGILGLSLEDERIFNEEFSQLEQQERTDLADFLFRKCKEFQRNRFINIVAGMEVGTGSPEKVIRSFEKRSNTTTTITTPALAGKNRRKDFLKEFAALIRAKGLSRVYKYAIARRLILEKTVHERAMEPLDETIDQLTASICRMRRKKEKKPYRGFCREALSFKF